MSISIVVVITRKMLRAADFLLAYRNQDTDENKLLEFERLKNRIYIIRFSSTTNENGAASVACGWLFGQGVCILDVQFHAEMTMDSHVTVVCTSAIFRPQHLEDQTVSDSSSDRASHTRICYLQTRCWQCTAISTASEANTSASESAELGSPLDLPTAPWNIALLHRCWWSCTGCR